MINILGKPDGVLEAWATHRDDLKSAVASWELDMERSGHMHTVDISYRWCPTWRNPLRHLWYVKMNLWETVDERD